MAAIAEHLAEALRALYLERRQFPSLYDFRIPAEDLARVDEWAGGEEGPSLEALAERLESWGSGFGQVEWGCERLERKEELSRVVPRVHYPPRWLVDRLDVGLRSLRAEQGLTQTALAKASGVKASEISAFERRETGVRPSVRVLDQLLQAIPASYAELEKAVRDPLRVVAVLERRLRQLRPLRIGGGLAPRVVSERFDLGLQVLRIERGLTRAKLAEASGVAESRVLALEQWLPSNPATEEEAKALLAALEATPEELEAAAAQPLGWLRDLDQRVERLERELGRETPLKLRGQEAPRIVNQRLDLAIYSLRKERAWSRKRLATASGLPHERIADLETWGRGEPATDREVEAIVEALEIEPAELEKSARRPLRFGSRLHQRTAVLHADLQRRQERVREKTEELDRRLRELEVPTGRVLVEEPATRIATDPTVREQALAVAQSVDRLRQSLRLPLAQAAE